MVERRQQDREEKAEKAKQGEALLQKVRGIVHRVSAAGYGVIKTSDHGEVMWRQYELPTNLRSLQFADPSRFQQEVQARSDYKRLKEMEGKEVEAELYKQADGQIRAWNVRNLNPSNMLTSGATEGSPPPPPAPRSEVDGLVACVRPVPTHWTEVELRERFEWYGHLVEVRVERRLYEEGKGDRRIPRPADDSQVFSFGVLRFDNQQCVEQVLQRENGASLDGQTTVSVEAGRTLKPLGWVEGTVSQYLTTYGVGLISSPKVEAGDIHFEAPEHMRATGADYQGMPVEANVEIGVDGIPQARQVGPPGSSGMMPQLGQPGLQGMQGWANDPYYKTQPCPYLRQGMCQMGQGCYFAHSMEELRPAPEQMMMGGLAAAMMMGGQAPKKPKKEKKEKKEKKSRREKEEQPPWRHPKAEGRSDGEGSSDSARGAYSRRSPPGGRRHERPVPSEAPRKKRRVELDDNDF